MANPTSNYGWVLPTSTDLVTDLPADFDVALQGVDTTTKALNPSTTLGDMEYRSATANTNTRLPIGTNGQVLSVVGGVPAWSSEAGDISSVTAGTGITGGGTSGAVTITNDMATTITTNGDLLYGTGSGTYTRRGIGSTGNVLTVSGGVPTWAAPAGGGKVAQVVSLAGTNTVGLTTTNQTVESLSITPTTNTSKIYASVTILLVSNCATPQSDSSVQATLFRGATALGNASKNQSAGMTVYVNDGGNDLTIPLIYLDSPATTSATTYSVQAKDVWTTRTSYAQACYITLWEILA
jgi:hypothetical protein